MLSKALSLLAKWPLLQQIRHGLDGTGLESMTDHTRNMRARVSAPDVKTSKSICPYCAVGCGQLVFHKDNKVIAIEGDPDSPISQGNLCPKGSASYQLVTQPERVTKIKYRAPYATEWTDIDETKAMDMIADRVWEARKKDWISHKDGIPVNNTTTRKTTSSRNSLPAAWAWCACPTRPEYDTPPRCPV